MKKFLLAFLTTLCLFAAEKADAQVSFGSAVRSGCAPLFVNFLDSSSVTGITSRSWHYTLGGSRVYMGSGGAAGLGYLFTTPGLYTITYTVVHSGGTDSLRRTAYIDVYAKPNIVLNVTPNDGCEPMTVCFDRSATTAGCGTLTKVIIDLGGGLVDSTSPVFCHTYSTAGSYDVSIVAKNSCGCQAFAVLDDTVDIDAYPVASFTASPVSSCTSPTTVNFTPSTVLPGYSYSWDFQNDGVWDAFTATASNTYTVGIYSVRMAVCSPLGCCDTLTIPNYINIQNNTVNFTTVGATTICEGGTVCLQDLSTGPVVSRTWAITPPTPGVSIPGTANPCFMIPTAGTYGITLTVTYTGGCSLTLTLPGLFTVQDGPVPLFTVSDSNDCNIPFTTSFINLSSPGATASPITTYAWTFPSGTPASASTAGPHSVTYSAYGNYGATLTVTDANGCSATYTHNAFIHVNQVSTGITATSVSGCPPVIPTFSADTTTGVVGENFASYSWNFGDPASGALNTATGYSVSHAYNNSGCYQVRLIAVSTSGCRDTVYYDSVCVGSIPTACYIPTPDTACFSAPEITFQLDSTCIIGDPDSIVFCFGDGPCTRLGYLPDSIIHSYNDTGEFQPTFTVFNLGCGDTIADSTIEVRIDGPIAKIKDSFSCKTPLTLYVRDTTSGDADSVFWDMGDTTSLMDTSSDLFFSWTYPLPGTYTVRLYEWNFTTGCVDTAEVPLIVEDTFVDFMASDTVFCAPQGILFTNISASKGLGSAMRWDFTSVFGTWSSPVLNGNTRTYTFSTPGVYTVWFRNTSARGCLDTIKKPNFITAHGVIPGWWADTTLCLGDPLIVDTNTTYAPMSYIDSVWWDFGDLLTTSDTSSAWTPSYTFTRSGTYSVVMQAWDSFGCMKSKKHTVTVLSPSARFITSDSVFCTGHALTVTNISSASGATYAWTFPGGTPATYTGLTPPPINYIAEGVYPISLTVTDANGCDTTAWDTVWVADPVAAVIGGPYSLPCPPFTFYAVDASYGNIVAWDWDFGDGTPHAYTRNPIHIYTIPGTYTVTLTVTSATGCISTLVLTNYISIAGPIGTLTFGPHKGCPCTSVEFLIETANAQNITFLPGDGLAIAIPVGIAGTTAAPRYDTITHLYCDTGVYKPRILLDDGVGCAIVLGTDSVVVDTINAKFGHLPIDVCDQGNVFFYDSSYSTVLSVGASQWYWEFGDGGISTAQNPVHFYAAPGDYEIVLGVGNGTACFDTIKMWIHIPASPVANFVCDSFGCVPLNSNFTDLTTTDTTIITWDWKFLPGATSGLQNPNYLFTSPGTYNVRLHVIDASGCDDSIIKPVIVNPIPAVNAGPDLTVCSGDLVTLNGSGAVTYVWTPNYYISDTSDRTPDVNPPDPTTYVLTGTDANGCFNVDSVLINAVQLLPNFTADTVCLGDTIHFTDLSVCNGSVINSWLWDFRDPFDLTPSNIPNPSHYYSTTGSFTVKLTITDTTGCTEFIQIPVIVTTSPIANFTADTVCFGDSTRFTDFSNPVIGAIVSWHWDFGDTNTSDQPSPVHLYSTPGNHLVTLTVNNGGCPDDTSFNIFVRPLPVAQFIVDTACPGLINHFTDVTILGSGAINSWYWNFGDSTTLADTAEIANPTYGYPFFGNFVASFEVTDIYGCYDDTMQPAFLVHNPIAAIQGDTNCFGDLSQLLDLSTATDLPLGGWSWDFGDAVAGDTSVLQNPTYTYSDSGYYFVNFTVYDLAGCSDTADGIVYIKPSPTADFTYANACLGDTTQFFDASISNSVSVTSWVWQFDVLGNSILQNPDFLFPAAGTYNIRLTVTNEVGCSNDTIIPIGIHFLPVSRFIADTVCFRDYTSLTDRSALGDTAISNWFWDFGTGNPADTSILTNNTFTYPASGYFPVSLAVTDFNGCSDDTTMNIRVFVPPSANFTTSPVCLGTNTNFIDLSVAGSNAITYWQWDFDDTPPAGSNASNPSHIYITPGNHDIELLIVDAEGCRDTAYVSVTASPNPVSLIDVDTNSVCLGDPVVFYDSSIQADAVTPLINHIWDFENDGTSDFSSPVAVPVPHTYPAVGTYTAQLIVEDIHGCVDTSYYTVYVRALPIADFSVPPACEGDAVQFTDLSTPGTGIITNWNWDFGDATGDVVSDPVHTYAIGNVYTATLVITDVYGCQASVSHPVLIDIHPNLSIYRDTILCPGESVWLWATGANTITWEPGGLTGDSVLVTPEYSTLYTATGVNGVCPPQSLQTTVNLIIPIPMEVTAMPTTIIRGSSSQLECDVQGLIDSVFWVPDSTLSCDNCLTPTATPDVTTTYTANIYFSISGRTCMNDDSVTVVVTDVCGTDIVFIPNTFTPNNDDQNDRFYIRGIAIDNINVMRIFDRWGQLIYEETDLRANDPQRGWDGTNFRNKAMAPGVYVYYSEMICANGDLITVKGNVTLIR